MAKLKQRKDEGSQVEAVGRTGLVGASMSWKRCRASSHCPTCRPSGGSQGSH